MNTNKRIDFIDNTRILLTILVVLVHTSVTYGGEGGWYMNEETNSMVSSILLTLFNAVSQSFFMSLFFLIGGYFTTLSLKKKGSLDFIKGRLLRLGLPLIFFFVAIGPLTVYLSDSLFYNVDFVYEKSMHVGPMWFAQALLIFSFFYLIYRKVFVKEMPKRIISLPIIILFLSITTFIARAIWPMGDGIWGMQLGSFPQYITMYAIGIAAGSTDWQSYLRSVKITRIISIIVTTIILLPLFMFLGEDPELGLQVFMGGLYWQAGLYAIWESAMCILLSLAVLSIMFRKSSEQNPLLKQMSRNSYAVYIIHAPVLVIISVLLVGITLHPLLKFLLTGSIVITLTYILSGLLVRLPGLRKVL